MRQTRRLAFDDLPPSPTPLHYYTLLTVRERRFVDVYLARLDSMVAAREAGFLDPARARDDLLSDNRVRCAIRERQDAISEMAGITAADLRRDLKLIHEADATEVSGVHRVPCRHCHGLSGQFQYTDAEMYYVEQAHSYGEERWPFSCVTNEFGPELHKHAQAAWLAGKEGRTLFIKGGGGYSRNREINPECSQCGGQGTPMAYICDTRDLSEGAKKIIRGIRVGADRVEVLTIDRASVRELLARDNRVGVERKELVVSLPRSPEEFRQTLEHMSVRELEEFISNVVTLGEGEYGPASTEALPAPRPNRFTRRA